MGISMRHLHRVFSSAGDSVCEFLRKGRLERCRGDLLDYRKRHLSIAEIAFRNGFISAGHFAESFKAEFGVTARSVRKSDVEDWKGASRITAVTASISERTVNPAGYAKPERA
jgi:AraC-like DNA-binding protein